MSRLSSVIITTRERPQLLRRAVESAFAAGSNVEVIVVDDASNDETRNVCRDLPGIRYVRLDRQQGVAGARNAGVAASSGEYITFLDDDDLRVPDSLDRQVHLLDVNSEAGLVYGQAVCVDQLGNASDVYPQAFPQGDVFWDLMAQNFIPCGSVLFRRTCLERVGLLDAGIAGIDDWDFWLRIAEVYPVIPFPEPVIHWRMPTPSSRQGTSNAAAIVALSIRRYRNRWSRLARAKTAPKTTRRNSWGRFSTNLATHLCWDSLRCLQHRRFLQALRDLLVLIKLGPFVWFRLWWKYGVTNRVLWLGRKKLVGSVPVGEV